MVRRGLTVAALGLAATGAIAKPNTPSLADLVADADRVWKLNEQGDVLEAGRQGETVVRAAEALREKGKLAEAREYYRRAGIVRPWNLDARLREAEALLRAGDAAGARRVADQVARFAETDRQLGECGRFTPLPPPVAPARLAELTPAAGEVVFGLVAPPDTERWLINAVARELAGRLGVRVGLASAEFAIGECSRTGRAELAENLRRSLPWNDPRFAVPLPSGERMDPAKMSDDQVIDLTRAVLKRGAQSKPLESFEGQVAEANQIRQWDTASLLQRLRESYPQPAQGRVVYLALVPVDLYSGSSNFGFGSASIEGNYAVVSYHRFAAANTGEPPSSERLVQRTIKQLLSSGGFALGVERCVDLRCARATPHSLAEIEAKGANLCPVCRAGFARALGHEPPAP